MAKSKKLTHEFICDAVEKNFEEAESYVVWDLDIVGKGFVQAFNKKMEELVPELKDSGLNYHKIYNQYGPQ